MEHFEADKPQLTSYQVPGSDKLLPVAFLPPNWQRIALADSPKVASHIEGCVTAADSDAFVHYFDRFKEEGTLVTADRNEKVISARLDYHRDSYSPRLNLHRLNRVLKTDRRFVLWNNYNKRDISQNVFVEFLEDNLADIINPDQGVVLRSATEFKANRNSTVVSVVNGASGDNTFQFHQETKAVSGTVLLPERITIRVPVFEFEREFDITARLRYRMTDEKKLFFSFDFVKIEEAIDIAFRRVVDDLQKDIKHPIILIA